MKIILSRKGFDSANGGIVSPIFEDGTMVSFPIPSDDEDTYDSLYYNGICCKDINYRFFQINDGSRSFDDAGT